jgi:hypothetical protein
MACIMFAILFLQSTDIARILGCLEDEMRVQCGLVICVYKIREKLPIDSSQTSSCSLKCRPFPPMSFLLLRKQKRKVKMKSLQHGQN